MRAKPLWIAAAALAAIALSPTVAHAAEGQFAAALERGWVWAYLFAFGAGFLTSLTPCVYPMIPITVAVFGARDTHVNRRKAFMLATCYVLGIAALYSILGTAFALAGRESGAGELLSNPAVVIPIVAIFVALAASMFGAFELNLPSSLQNKLSAVGGKGYAGAFAMGLVGGVIAAPCTGPPLFSILIWVSTTGRPLAGASILFVYAIGMGVLFWVLAVFAVSMPKSGRWMEAVKSFFGVVMVVAAIYFLGNIAALKQLHHADPDPRFFVGSLIVAAIGIAIGAIHLSFHASWPTRLRKGLGVALAVIGAIGAVNWVATPERVLTWRTDEAQAFADARDTGKHVLIDFGAEWCAPCKEIEKIMGSDELYDDIDRRFIPYKIDLTEITDDERATQERYDAGTLPAVVFVTADGRILGRYDEKSPSQASFRARLEAVSTGSR